MSAPGREWPSGVEKPQSLVVESCEERVGPSGHLPGLWCLSFLHPRELRRDHGMKEWGRCSLGLPSLAAGACSCGFKLANGASPGWRDKEGRKGPRAAARGWVRLEKEVSGHRQESVDVTEGTDGHSGDRPVPCGAGTTWPGCLSPPGAIPDGLGAPGLGERRRRRAVGWWSALQETGWNHFLLWL